MQTFLPYEDFVKSANVLDYKRLGKQRVEAKQILNALDGLSKGWVNHPATKMWRGYEGYLALYGLTMCEAWKARGYNDSLTDFFKERMLKGMKEGTYKRPHWLGNEALHVSHQSNLLRKDPEFYGKVFDNVPDDFPYVWIEGVS